MVSINRGKETARELEQLRKCSKYVTLSNAKIATQVSNNTRQRFQTDLEVEKPKNDLLQDKPVELKNQFDVQLSLNSELFMELKALKEAALPPELLDVPHVCERNLRAFLCVSSHIQMTKISLIFLSVKFTIILFKTT